jgi:hypothetical protein
MSNPAGATMNENPLSAAEFAVIKDRLPRGQCGHADGAGVEMIEPGRFFHDLVRRGRGILGVGAPVVIEHSKNLIAHPEVFALRFLDDSGNVAPEDGRKLRPETEGSLPNLAIDRIDPSRVDTDQDLVTGRFGRGHFLVTKHRWCAKLMYSGGFHSEFSTGISKNGNTSVATWINNQPTSAYATATL